MKLTSLCRTGIYVAEGGKLHRTGSEGENEKSEVAYNIAYLDRYMDRKRYSKDDIGSGYKPEMLNYFQIETNKGKAETIVNGASGIIFNSSGMSVAQKFAPRVL